ncbi:MAG: xanthine dehydrogenase accessory protein XdhC [Woeseia sp.]
MTSWLREARKLLQTQTPAVRVTVAGIRGSAPREVGASMLVTASDLCGSIGGGQLEYQCAQIASRYLRGDDNRSGGLRRFPLGSNCGQCCGGVVDVLFQRLDAIACIDDLLARWQDRDNSVLLTQLDTDGQPQNRLLSAGGRATDGSDIDPSVVAALVDTTVALRLGKPGRDAPFVLLEPLQVNSFEVALFGAGHVGSALIPLLSGVDATVRWVDSRRDVFPASLPHNVQVLETTNPAREVAALPADSYCLVMTHSHALDFEITAAILRRGEFAYCGLIGSLSKRRRFESRLRQAGLGDLELQRLTCPIGISGISGKQPQEIAIAVAADLLRRRERRQAALTNNTASVQALRPRHKNN